MTLIIINRSITKITDVLFATPITFWTGHAGAKFIDQYEKSTPRNPCSDGLNGTAWCLLLVAPKRAAPYATMVSTSASGSFMVVS
ncbi:predicted protein [Lichtheimia corymbifera JMRC:FSU:9682]|uniref:Uncharacterized protein n=1 Tax=Lichtheimia corymbifera JMRC:FSU:9682 TaxID=1263082 RepID=A0A068RSY7_9FUNG|nr:predicted protein [Lichtheimia corymbifera JMRC:FSU:9682]